MSDRFSARINRIGIIGFRLDRDRFYGEIKHSEIKHSEIKLLPYS